MATEGTDCSCAVVKLITAMYVVNLVCWAAMVIFLTIFGK